jgi:aminopeptidase N
MAEQAAYDVTFYDLALRVDPATQSIEGALTVSARVVHPLNWFVLDLDEPLAVSAVASVDDSGRESPLKFERRGDRVWIAFSVTKQPGERLRVRVRYGGRPHVATNAPWDGGFVWQKTSSGAPWIAVACQGEGGDIWWPCKDHPSDEPDGVALHITVPEPLVCAANGKQGKVTSNGDGTRTFDWEVSTPINNYDVSINIAPYATLEDSFTSVSGETVPVRLWVLPENVEKGRQLLVEVLKYARFMESKLGPFPFRADKLGVAEVPYLGMEHQTIIAYGNEYRRTPHGHDWLMFHELGHEWWGNLVTASDWRDMWLHEGFQSYLDSLYVEAIGGEAALRDSIAGKRRQLNNLQPVAPRESRTAREIYNLGPDYVRSDGDIYSKGALVLHTLRYLVGDEAFFKAYRQMAYPDPALERVSDGGQCRFATTDDFLHIVEEVSGRDLDWFFEVYLRQPKLPKLVTESTGGELRLRWEVPNGLSFPMPVEVRVGGAIRRVEMPNGSATVPIGAGETPAVDPRGWVLRD